MNVRPELVKSTVDDKLKDTECLHRFLGECLKCVPDYDPNHHPNNLDCPRYYKIGVSYITVKDSSDNDNI